MPDISMCQRKDCPKKSTCYRYKAVPSCHQSYILIEDTKNCEYYWAVDKRQLKK